MLKFEIYKRGQGKWTRLCTFIGVMVIGLVGAAILPEKIMALWPSSYVVYMAYGIPTVIVVGLAALMFWVVNRPTWADFMIATESEMKKVSWSSRKEVLGSTKVVIVTTFIMATVLFGVDVLFTLLFQMLHVMG